MVCCYCCQAATVVSDSVQPQRWQPTRLPVPGILQARSQWSTKSKFLGTPLALHTDHINVKLLPFMYVF